MRTLLKIKYPDRQLTRPDLLPDRGGILNSNPTPTNMEKKTGQETAHIEDKGSLPPDDIPGIDEIDEKKVSFVWENGTPTRASTQRSF